MAEGSSSKDREIASLSSLPIWFWGKLSTDEDMRWYHVDVAIEDIFDQREARMLHRRQQRQSQKAITGYDNDNDNEEFILELSPPFNNSLGLVIEADSILLGKGNATTTLALGSLIFFTGDYNEYNMKVAALRCLDTRNIDKGWKTYEMITPRWDPLMAALDGKIYIAGGTQKTPWAEVFDPVTHESKPLLNFPAELFGNSRVPTFHFMGAVPDYQTLLFCSYHSPGYMLYYNVITQSWDCVVDRVIGSREPRDAKREGCAVVGTIIYWFSPDFTFYAYDFIKFKVFSSGPMRGDFNALGTICDWDYYCPDSPTLLHLNGDCFCLVWSDGRFLGTECLFTQIHCTKLDVRCIDSTESLSVSVLSSHTYLIHGDFDVYKALLVNSSAKGDLFTPWDGESSREYSLVGAEFTASSTGSDEEVK